MDTIHSNPAPEAFTSRLEYRVSYADTDAMGVVYYANYLVYFERARTQLLRELGLPYREIEARGIGLPVLEAKVDYHAPAEYDDLLQLCARVGWCRGARIQLLCEVFRHEVLLASGYTVHACLDLKSRRPVRMIPELGRLAVS